MLEVLTTFLSSGGLGGFLGLLGSGIGKWLKGKEQIAKMKLEMEFLERKADIQDKLRKTDGSYDGLVASIKADAVADDNAYKWVASIKALFRPFLTTALVVITAWLIIGGYIPQLTLEQYISCILNLTTTAVVWWFGDRGFNYKR